MVFTQYTDEEKQAYVDDYLNSGQTMAVWCQGHDVPKGTIYGWLRNYRKYGTPFIPRTEDDVSDAGTTDKTDEQDVVLIRQEPEPVTAHDNHDLSDTIAEISYGDITIRIKQGITPYVLESILSFAGGAR